MMGSAKAHYDGIKAFSETDFTEDPKIIDVATLITHGDDDQIVPIADSAPLSVKLLKNATLKVYENFPARHVHDPRRRRQPGHPRLHQGTSPAFSLRTSADVETNHVRGAPASSFAGA
jgi:pimeloyl-ACP methyl ester carboxylesterase